MIRIKLIMPLEAVYSQHLKASRSQRYWRLKIVVAAKAYSQKALDLMGLNGKNHQQ